MRWSGLMLLVIALTPLSAHAVDEPDRSRIDLHVAPLLDLHQHIRAVAAGSAEALPLDGLTVAVEAAQTLEQHLGPMGWGMLEGNFIAATDGTDLLERCSQLPQVTQRDEVDVPLRRLATTYAETLVAIEPAFMQAHWPARLAELESARQALAATLSTYEARCLAHIIDSLGMDDPHITIPVHLVTQAPSPGAATYRTRSGSACVVAIDELPPLQLLEIALHEASHALDLATMRQPTALMQLRRSLPAAGIAPTDPMHRDVWHTVMFIQSAETVRRIIDADHEDYGDRSGYYERVAPIAQVQRPIWRRYLDGEMALEEAVQRIIAEVTPARR